MKPPVTPAALARARTLNSRPSRNSATRRPMLIRVKSTSSVAITPVVGRIGLLIGAHSLVTECAPLSSLDSRAGSRLGWLSTMRSLQQIVDCAADALSRPVLIDDAALRPLAQSGSVRRAPHAGAAQWLSEAGVADVGHPVRIHGGES